jgi:CRP-like cAMP-binding protein
VDPEVLKKAPLFAGLEDEAATALSSAMGSLHLNKGDVLFHEGDSEDRLYIVVSGKIKLGRSGSAGRENLLAVLGPGQMFGDKRDDGMHVHHDLTQEELAQLVGASRETVNKALADFAARGWIRLEPRSVTILDVERVERRAR